MRPGPGASAGAFQHTELLTIIAFSGCVRQIPLKRLRKAAVPQLRHTFQMRCAFGGTLIRLPGTRGLRVAHGGTFVGLQDILGCD